MVPLGDDAQVEARFGLSDIVLILMQDSCMVCVDHAIGSEIVWMHPMELLGDVGHVESHFFPFVDSVSVGARLVHGLC